VKTIKFVGFLFYRYYSRGQGERNPYFRTVLSMTLLGFFHLMQILILARKVDIIPIKPGDSTSTKRLLIGISMLPIFVIMMLLFKKSDIKSLKEKYDNDWDKVSSGNVWLVVYMLLSFSLIFILASIV